MPSQETVPGKKTTLCTYHSYHSCGHRTKKLQLQLDTEYIVLFLYNFSFKKIMMFLTIHKTFSRKFFILLFSSIFLSSTFCNDGTCSNLVLLCICPLQKMLINFILLLWIPFSLQSMLTSP